MVAHVYMKSKTIPKHWKIFKVKKDLCYKELTYLSWSMGACVSSILLLQFSNVLKLWWWHGVCISQ